MRYERHEPLEPPLVNIGLSRIYFQTMRVNNFLSLMKSVGRLLACRQPDLKKKNKKNA